VVFAGRVPDSRRGAAHYGLGTIFVLLSRSTGRYDGLEGFGLRSSSLEPRVAVIGGRTGGIPEAVRDGGSGLVLPPKDPAVLAEDDRGAARTIPARCFAWAEYGRRFAAEHAGSALPRRCGRCGGNPGTRRRRAGAVGDRGDRRREGGAMCGIAGALSLDGQPIGHDAECAP
jgi:hypothetical protein